MMVNIEFHVLLLVIQGASVSLIMMFMFYWVKSYSAVHAPHRLWRLYVDLDFTQIVVASATSLGHKYFVN
jgi:hypothetical protein